MRSKECGVFGWEWRRSHLQPDSRVLSRDYSLGILKHSDGMIVGLWVCQQPVLLVVLSFRFDLSQCVADVLTYCVLCHQSGASEGREGVEDRCHGR